MFHARSSKALPLIGINWLYVRNLEGNIPGHPRQPSTTYVTSGTSSQWSTWHPTRWRCGQTLSCAGDSTWPGKETSRHTSTVGNLVWGAYRSVRGINRNSVAQLGKREVRRKVLRLEREGVGRIASWHGGQGFFLHFVVVIIIIRQHYCV